MKNKNLDMHGCKIPTINPLTNKPYVRVDKKCKRCDNWVFKTDVKGYPFVCLYCDENMFNVETYVSGLDRMDMVLFKDMLKRASGCNLLTMVVMIDKIRIACRKDKKKRCNNETKSN